MKESRKVLCICIPAEEGKHRKPVWIFHGSSETKSGTYVLKGKISTQLHILVMKTFITKQKNIHVLR